MSNEVHETRLLAGFLLPFRPDYPRIIQSNLLVMLYKNQIRLYGYPNIKLRLI